MPARRGISLLELLPLPAGSESLVPNEIASQLSLLTVLDYQSTTTASAFVHTGTAQAMLDALNVNTRGYVFRAPGITDGSAFRLAVARPAPAASGTTVEDVGPAWQLDLFLQPVELQLPFRAGDLYTNAEGLVTVQPDPGRQNVWLVGSAVLRVASDATGHVTVEFVDQPDPFDMARPTGPVVDLTVTPPTFVFGSTQYGMTLDKFEIDASNSYTPPDVMARGQDEAWQGLAFREATFYAPPTTPIVGALSIGLRDVIIGTPFGMQGEMAIQLGQDPSGANFATVVAVRQTATGTTDVPIPAGTNGSIQVPVDAGSGTASYYIRFTLPAGPTPPPGGNPPGAPDNTPRGIWWQLPNGTQGTSLTTPAFTVPNPGDPSAALRYRVRVGTDAPSTPANVTTVPDGQVELSEVRIVLQGPTVTTGPAAHQAAKVALTMGTVTWNNVASITGPHDVIAGLTFSTVPADAGARWQFDNGSSSAGAQPGTGNASPLTIPTQAGVHDLVMTSNQANRHVRVEITNGGPLLVGHGRGPGGNADVAATPDTLAHTVQPLNKPSPPNAPSTPDPGHTFDLRTYNASGTLVASSADATYAGLGDPLTVPDGTVAQLTVTWTDDQTQANQASGSAVPASPSTPAAPAPNRQFTVDNYNVNDPSPPPGQVAALLAWARSALPTGSGAPARVFYVVGRTDDLWLDAQLASNTSQNKQLAASRAQGIASVLLAQLPGSSFTVLSRGEQDSASWPAELATVDPLALSATRNAVPTDTPSPPNHPVWKHEWSRDSANASAHATAEATAERGHARRVDVYIAPDPAPTPGINVPSSPGSNHSGTTPQPNSRMVLVPGEDTPNPPTVRRTLDQASPTKPWMVRLAAKWDSPVVATLADAIPTDCELTIAWAAADTVLPRSAGTIPPPAGAPGASNIWLLQGKWTYDSRSGENAFTLALTLPDSVLTWNSDFLAWALALAPALSGLLPQSDVAGEAVSFVGLMVLGGATGTLINGSSGKNKNGSPHAHTDSKLHIHRMELDYHGQADSRVRFALDYTTELNVNFSIFGQSLVGDGLKMKFKNVALEVDFTSTTLEGVKLDYTQFSVEVENPGTWAIGGALGNLLNISNPHVGNQSTWIQFDVSFAIDLGVIQLNGATIRIIMDGPDIKFEIRGLQIGVNIPGTLSGQGALSVGDDGTLRGLISVTVIPTKLNAYAALSIKPPFVALEMGVQLPVGIPLASSGLAIYGFMGRFVANGARDLTGLPTSDVTLPTYDPVQRELDWYCRPPQNKYAPFQGEFGLGIGAVIGTMPDGGTTFNAQGMIAVSFPDVSVDLGIDARLITPRKSAAAESGDQNEVGSQSSQTFRILGVIVFNPDSLILGVRGSYVIPKVLDLEIPINGYFPFHSGGPGGDCYLRVGSDGVTSEGRTGTPVQIKLFPGSLDVMAWAFLMIEERKLHRLGNDATLNFDGFSIGFGAGFNLDWGSSSVGIHAGAQMLLGIGTNPLTFAGMIGVHGELSLVVVSISFEGDIRFIIAEQAGSTVWHLHGHFCASIDCFFFSISGCVDIDFGSNQNNPIPIPASPIKSLDLTDHLGAVKGKALRVGGSDSLPTVWPDTVPVAHFTHYIDDQAAAGGVFTRLAAEPATDNPWSGTNDLKYAFRLHSLELWKYPNASFTGGSQIISVGQYDSAWWLPTHRPGVATADNSASPLEGRDLGLMWWNPAPWSRWLGEGSEAVPGDPSNTWGKVCDPPPPPTPVCALGQSAVQLDQNTVQMVPAAPSALPFSSFFTVSGGLPAGLSATLPALASALGLSITPGGVRTLPVALNLPGGSSVTAGYMLQMLTREGRLVGSAPFAGRFSTSIGRCSLVLLVCPQALYNASGCDDFTDLPVRTQLSNPFTHKGIGYRTAENKPVVINGQHGLAFSNAVRITLAQAVSSVTVTVFGLHQPAFKLIGIDAKGKPVAQASGAPATDAGAAEITLTGPNILYVEVSGGARAALLKVCWTLSAATMLQTVYGRPATQLPAAPVLLGTDSTGKQSSWNSKLIATPLAPVGTPSTGISAVYIPPKCQLLVYTPADPAAFWTGFEIEPALATVEILSVCGITAAALAAQQQDAVVRSSLQNAWNHASGLASGTSGSGTPNGTPSSAGDNGPNSTRPHLFVADSFYELRFNWQYQGWRADTTNSAAQNAPLPLSPTWQPGGNDVFRFHTAKEGTSTPQPSAPGDHFLTDPSQAGAVYDESVFDAHGLARYLIGFTPAPNDPPQYLDDPIFASFNADHLQTLLDLYARTLRVKVRRTDPPPGSFNAPPPNPNAPHPVVLTPQPAHALDVDSSTSWGPLPAAMMFSADARAQNAATAAPCLNDNGGFGGTQATVTADLQPNAEYDLLLVAAPNGNLELDEVLVARSHFLSSAYKNPAEQMMAMGFGPVANPVPWAPHDFEVTAKAPAATLHSDASLVATLAAMGLTSEPVPPLPQATALWIAPSGGSTAWQLAGLMLESDEPLLRDGRLTIVSATLASSAGTTAGTLTLWASNHNATRALLAAATPFSVPAGSNVLTITFQKPGSASASLSRVLFERPLTRLQEGA